MHFSKLLLVPLLDFALGAKYDLLKNVRKQGEQVIPMTLKQKRQVLKGMNSMFDVYVNREVKIEAFQSEVPNIDPVPRLKALEANIANVTDLEFHLELLDIANSQRDVDMTYSMPAPYQCYILLMPLNFASFADGGEEKVMLERIYQHEYFKRLTPESKDFKAGDEILKVNGVDIMKHLDTLKFQDRSPNAAGVIDSGVNFMWIRESQLSFLPKEDVLEFEIKRGEQILTLNMPWVVEIKDHCKPSATAIDDSSEKTVPSLQRSAVIAQQEPLSELGTPEKKYKVSYEIYKENGHNMGIIDPSFPGHETTAQMIFESVRDVLTNELKDTDSILFDVRWTQNDIVGLSDLLPQLVIPEYSPSLARFVKSPTNDKVFSAKSKYPNEKAKKVYQETPTGAKYTPPMRLNDVKIDSVGQVYAKPVGVMIGGITTGSAEVFAATMQDHGNVVIYGGSASTCGAGSNGINN